MLDRVILLGDPPDSVLIIIDSPRFCHPIGLTCTLREWLGIDKSRNVFAPNDKYLGDETGWNEV